MLTQRQRNDLDRYLTTEPMEDFDEYTPELDYGDDDDEFSVDPYGEEYDWEGSGALVVDYEGDYWDLYDGDDYEEHTYLSITS